MVQKCKVVLRNYSSALSGFQSIINANQYNYLGLLARWDYMATSLLAPGGGSYSPFEGGVRQPADGGMFDDNNQYVASEPHSDIDMFWGDDDKSPFSREQKKQIISSVGVVLSEVKQNGETRIKQLEQRTERGDKKAEKELAQVKTLKEVIKTERPKTTFEHIKIVSSDAQKVFGNTSAVSNIKNNNIPEVFSLSQNYPNPFNPTTTIRYGLPVVGDRHAYHVQIKIYDILGREVKVLVNEIQQAGYYDVKFDGKNLASGVYFYRIEAEEYILAKKMVLVK
jgi:hypothetical protein